MNILSLKTLTAFKKRTIEIYAREVQSYTQLRDANSGSALSKRKEMITNETSTNDVTMKKPYLINNFAKNYF